MPHAPTFGRVTLSPHESLQPVARRVLDYGDDHWGGAVAGMETSCLARRIGPRLLALGAVCTEGP